MQIKADEQGGGTSWQESIEKVSHNPKKSIYSDNTLLLSQLILKQTAHSSSSGTKVSQGLPVVALKCRKMSMLNDEGQCPIMFFLVLLSVCSM